MSDKMDDLFANVKKMVDSGNIPPEIAQMMNNLQSQGSNNNSSNNSNGNSTNNQSNNNMDLNNLLNQVSPEMINNLSNILKSSGQSNYSGSTGYGNNNNHSNGFGTNSSNSSNNNSNNFNLDINTIMKMKSIMENMNNKNDPRANLLYSLKPYLRDSKKDKLDQYVNMLNISKIADIMNKPNNDKKND